MEEYLRKFKTLLKNSLYRLEQDSLSKEISIIDEYNIDEVYEELKFLIETLIAFKENCKADSLTKKKNPGKENWQKEHIHLLDISSEKNSLKLNSDLKRKLKDIKERYLMKISKLLDIHPITITPMPITNSLSVCEKHHLRKPSSFKSLNCRHPGSGRNGIC